MTKRNMFIVFHFYILMELSDRTYNCECGLSIDRDLNSAKNILNIGQGLTKFKPVEKSLISKNQEDTRSLA